MAKRNLTRVEESIVNKETGEIAVVRKTFTIKAESAEEFFMTFLSGLNAICELTRPSDIKVLALLCAKAEFNTGVARLSTEDRKEMERRLGYSTQAFTNSIGRLKKLNLISGSRGSFEINPHCFWKGTTNERNRLLSERSMDLEFKFRGNGFED